MQLTQQSLALRTMASNAESRIRITGATGNLLHRFKEIVSEAIGKLLNLLTVNR